MKIKDIAESQREKKIIPAKRNIDPMKVKDIANSLRKRLLHERTGRS